MRRIIGTMSAVLLVALLVGMPGPAALGETEPIAVDGTPRLKDVPAPPQPTRAEAAAAVAAGSTTESRCLGGDDATLTITLTSNDPANPGSQDVVFFRESVGTSATLWVAWDFLDTAYGRHDVITCEQLAYLQGSMDSIVATDVRYFGEYVERPEGNANIDVMIYNIVDESYYDPTFPFYIAGFFWGSINETFDRNMVFIDSYDWANRLGPDAARPFLYEGTVAHELEHLIHNDHDPDELSWVDEGLADLAELLNGFGHPDSHVVYYLAFHRNSLTDWLSGLEDYGAAYLFQLYLLENFGTKVDGVWDPAWTLGLVEEDLNSIAGVEAQTGADFEDLFDAWILANYVDRPELAATGGLPLGYGEIDLAPYRSTVYGDWSIKRAVTDIYGADAHGNLPVARYYGGYVSGSVEYPIGGATPYGPVYRTYAGFTHSLTAKLRGAAQSGVAPHEGTYEVASGSANMLTDRMLLLNVPVGGTLTFWTWYDIEEEWDFAFVEVSTDGGVTWMAIPGSITRTSVNPNNSTAWANSLVAGQASSDAAITGSSGGWVPATFELPAASDVRVRFSYYTDEAVLEEGWFIDEVAVDGFNDGFEAGAASWTLGGWSHTTGLFDNDWVLGWAVPQKYAPLLYGTVDDGYDAACSGTNPAPCEFLQHTIETIRLKGNAMVVLANRPGEAPFEASYRILVSKR